MAIEIVDFPSYKMVIFHGKMLVHQRVSQPTKMADVRSWTMDRSDRKKSLAIRNMSDVPCNVRPPATIAKLVNMVYGSYSYSYWGL